MNRLEIIDKTVKVINQLPENKAEEIADFADFMIKKYEEEMLTKSLQQFASESNTFSFLAEDEELYSLSDLKKSH